MKTDEVQTTEPPVDDDTKADSKKKTFVMKDYGLKQQNRPSKKLDTELDTVREYNQHYFYNHPPNPLLPLSMTIQLTTHYGQA